MIVRIIGVTDSNKRNCNTENKSTNSKNGNKSSNKNTRNSIVMIVMIIVLLLGLQTSGELLTRVSGDATAALAVRLSKTKHELWSKVLKEVI